MIETGNLVIVKTGSTLPDLARRRGDFEDWIAQGLRPLKRHRLQVVDASKGQPLPNARDCAGVVITGSHAMVTDREEWSERVAAWLPAVVDAAVPLLGICYGHQLLAHAMGGIVGPTPGGGEFGTVELHLTQAALSDCLFQPCGTRIDAQATHFQSVLALPAGATLLASSALDEHHAFSIGSAAWGVQFHPEFDAEILRAYITQRARALEGLGLDPSELAGEVRESLESRRVLQRFGLLVERRPLQPL